MAKQNRVTPFSTLISTSARGTLYGNRGCLHDKNGQIRKQFQGHRWLICLLEFKGRKHPIMHPGLYTDLFFLDEATALAAGHRPCAECQRGPFNLFRQYWAAANPNVAESDAPLAPVMDAVLHKERLGAKPFCDSINELPNGTFVTNNGIDAYLVRERNLYLWTPAGYEQARTSIDFPVRLLTPASVVKALGNGYPVAIHKSAFHSPAR